MPIINKKNKNNLIYIGVTGTFGKTIVVETLVHILKSNGYRVASLSSKGNSIDGMNVEKEINSDNISKSQFRDLSKKAEKNGCQFFIVEMHIDKIKDNVFADVDLDTGIITNIVGEDEKYESWGKYAAHKLDFIKKIINKGLLIVNGDEEKSVAWLGQKDPEIKNEIYVFWANSNDLNNKFHGYGEIGYKAENGHDIRTNVSGFHNHLNTYMAFKAASKFIDSQRIVSAMQTFKNPNGILHLYKETPYKIYVDRADTPYTTLRAMKFLESLKSGNKIISITGSEGNQNKHKRKIGDVISKFSDVVILAPNNPNTELTSDINSEIHNYTLRNGGILVDRFGSNSEVQQMNVSNLLNKVYSTQANGNTPVVAFDAHDYTGRLDAINFATQVANPGDFIYVSGKGDSDSILFNNVEYEWSDYEAINLALASAGIL